MRITIKGHMSLLIAAIAEKEGIAVSTGVGRALRLNEPQHCSPLAKNYNEPEPWQAKRKTPWRKRK